LFNLGLALMKGCICFSPGSLRKAIDDKEVAVSQPVLVQDFRGTNVAIKSSRSVRFEFRTLA
jgi:hypothetical protein